ncbi:hypothetical protein PSQ19_16795 [Devosia algicola]|uniref:Yip1 domain-containing protein n=1 Tax=Devosia algicola TaxID=3026418 RepID=A0ABY7YLT8_9HYPH|nr:hypothetical protein [Devosia algicola]WDR02270.1 hypothetical protein PSQ19_16795 [Devosia algicola]
MKIWQALRGAFRGWAGILRDGDEWRSNFRLSAAGLITALVIFVLVALVATLVSTMGQSMPQDTIAGAVFAECLGLVAIVVAILLLCLLTRHGSMALLMIVPAIYALAAYVVARSALAAISGSLAGLALLGLGYLLYRLVRTATKLNPIGALVFAILALALLVAMPASLYMLTIPATSSL